MHQNKQTVFSIVVAAIILLASCGGGKPKFNASLKNEVDSASYFFGYHLGVQLAYSEIEKIDDINFNAMAKGVKEAIENGKEVDEFKMQELSMFLTQYIGKLQNRVSEKTLKEGQDWLEANKKKQGVVSLPSGLQYKIIKEGTGIKPSIDDVVDVMYHGSLIDGTVFESSRESGDTVSFPVGNMVEGFKEALTLMNEGSIWEVYIPAELGYGENVRQGGPIPPQSALIFEINMIRVIKDEE